MASVYMRSRDLRRLLVFGKHATEALRITLRLGHDRAL
jgi:hypothetical protein